MSRIRLRLLALVAAVGAPACTVDDGAAPLSRARSAVTAREPTVVHALPPIRSGQFPAGRGAPAHGGGVQSGTWTTVANTPPIAAGFSILLTDGSVMVQDLTIFGGDWWKLSPDATGSYAHGTWTQLASMPNGYAPLYFASAVLPDGRVIVIGGEYQAFVPVWQTQGAVYDPVADHWTAISGPAGWATIGDAQSIVLADGRYVIANCCTTEMAVLDPATLTWSTITSAGKADLFDEEGWTLLPDGTLLTVDSNNAGALTNSEIYTPPDAQHGGGWASAGSTIVQVSDFAADGTGSWEVGPALLRPDGTVFQSGATGHTTIFDLRTRQWRAGPEFPVIAGEGQLDQADGPAALLPNGNVLVAASAGVFNIPAHFLEFDGANLVEVAAPADAAFDSSFNINFVLLPSGEILETDFSGDVEIYQPSGASARACRRDTAPQIEALPRRLERGATYALSGEQLHGISAGVSYGDDAQAATNYPIVRITNRATGHVQFARTRDFSNFSIARGARSTAKLEIPATLEPGVSDLVAITNGIASEPVRVLIR
jgi:hypothetical protein